MYEIDAPLGLKALSQLNVGTSCLGDKWVLAVLTEMLKVDITFVTEHICTLTA